MLRVDHYQVLGVPVTADAHTVRRAYLRLARQHHPDFHTDDGAAIRRRSERTMQRVNEAWAVLGDQARRRDYDRALARAVRPAPASAGPAPEPDVGPDDIDLDLLDDDPLTDAQVRGSWTLLPVALFFTSIALFSVALVLQAGPMLALSVMVFVLSGLAFVVLPFVALATSRRDDLADGGRA